jgi:hypothetical protein
MKCATLDALAWKRQGVSHSPGDASVKIGGDCCGMETAVMALEKLQIAHEHSFSCDNSKLVKQGTKKL